MVAQNCSFIASGCNIKAPFAFALYISHHHPSSVAASFHSSGTPRSSTQTMRLLKVRACAHRDNCIVIVVVVVVIRRSSFVVRRSSFVVLRRRFGWPTPSPTAEPIYDNNAYSSSHHNHSNQASLHHHARPLHGSTALCGTSEVFLF